MTQQNAPILAKHRDEAARAAGYVNWREVGILNDRDGMIGLSVIAHAQNLANLEALNNRLAEIARLLGPLTANELSENAADRAEKAHALASGHAPSPCPSCDGMNISCPEGCERDPMTGELIPWACPSCAAKDEAMEAFRREVSDAVVEFGKSSRFDVARTAESYHSYLSRFIIPPADPVAEALKAAIHAYGGELIEGENFDMAVAELKSRLPLGGAK